MITLNTAAIFSVLLSLFMYCSYCANCLEHVASYYSNIQANRWSVPTIVQTFYVVKRLICNVTCTLLSKTVHVFCILFENYSTLLCTTTIT